MASHFPLRATWEAVILAAAVPVLAVNPAYAPGISLSFGGASLSIETGDVAMLAVALATLAVARREGWAPLRNAGMVLVPAGLLVLSVILATLFGPQLTEGYPLAAKIVSAAKFLEYAVLVVAVPVIVRGAADAKAVAASVVATGVAATGWATLQLVGFLPNFDNVPAGRRMPAFAGYHDFAILSGLTLAVAVGAVALGHPRSSRPFVWLAASAGVVGIVIAGALSAVLALLLGIAFAIGVMFVRKVATSARVAALVAIAVIVLTGSGIMRSGDAADFIGFLDPSSETTQTGVETYSQRTVLSYIGLRIFLDHPFGGVGWQASELPVNVEPFLADVRRRFPDVTEEALPSAAHPWGVQNAYIQAAADMGVAGLVFIVWLALAAIIRSGRATLSRQATVALALPVTVASLVCVFEWAALGLVAGGPATALIWFTFGSAVAVGGAMSFERPAAASTATSPVSP